MQINPRRIKPFFFHNREQHYERTFPDLSFSQNYPFQQGKVLQGY